MRALAQSCPFSTGVTEPEETRKFDGAMRYNHILEPRSQPAAGGEHTFVGDSRAHVGGFQPPANRLLPSGSRQGNVSSLLHPALRSSPFYQREGVVLPTNEWRQALGKNYAEWEGHR